MAGVIDGAKAGNAQNARTLLIGLHKQFILKSQ